MLFFGVLVYVRCCSLVIGIVWCNVLLFVCCGLFVVVCCLVRGRSCLLLFCGCVACYILCIVIWFSSCVFVCWLIFVV